MVVYMVGDTLYSTNASNLKRFAKDSDFNTYSSRLRETFIVEEAGAKIVYVDTGSSWDEFKYQVWDTVKFVQHVERKDEINEGFRGPRLIFILQDKDYWPRAKNKLPDVIARRADKEKAHKESNWCYPPDHYEMYVPKIWKVDRSILWPPLSKCEVTELCDPKLPGAKFIVDHLDSRELLSIKNYLTSMPELLASFSSLCIDGSSSSSN